MRFISEILTRYMVDSCVHLTRSTLGSIDRGWPVPWPGAWEHSLRDAEEGQGVLSTGPADKPSTGRCQVFKVGDG